MSPLLIDIAIIVILIIFALCGAKKGLILSLFSCLALFVAFYGAREVTVRFADPIADIIRPSIQLTINEVLEGETPAGTTVLPETDAPEDDSELEGESEGEGSVTRDFSLRQILTVLQDNELYEGFQDYLDEAVRANAVKITTTAASAVAAYLSVLVAKWLLFGLSFVLILLLWFLASRALDLAFKLPILSAINGIGGFLFGLVKGVAIMLVLVWLGKLGGWLTEGNIGPVTSMMTVEKLSALLRDIISGAYIPA